MRFVMPLALAALLQGCENSEATLFRHNVLPKGEKMRVATFNGDVSRQHNIASCEVVRSLLEERFKDAEDMRFSCEPSYGSSSGT